jgi:PAS domain S-box-containing protein
LKAWNTHSPAPWDCASLIRIDLEVSTSQEEADAWRERYQILFERNIAGIILATPEGKIIDCNEPCARIFGFDRRDEMLKHTAWDFYFHKAERETLVHQLQTRRNSPTEQVCMRHNNGTPVWILGTRTVVSFAQGRPDLLQGTLIDITMQRKARALLEDIDTALSAGMPRGENAQVADLAQRLAALLLRARTTLRPENLSQIGKAEIQQFILDLEQMKMLMSELAILNLLHE